MRALLGACKKVVWNQTKFVEQALRRAQEFSEEKPCRSSQELALEWFLVLFEERTGLE